MGKEEEKKEHSSEEKEEHETKGKKDDHNEEDGPKMIITFPLTRGKIGLTMPQLIQVIIYSIYAILIALYFGISLLAFGFISYYHSHLFSLCNYLEFYFVAIMLLITLLFSFYHLCMILKFFFLDLLNSIGLFKKSHHHDHEKKPAHKAQTQTEEMAEMSQEALRKLRKRVVQWKIALQLAILLGKIIGLILGFAAFVVLICFAVAICVFQQWATPQYSGDMLFNGLTGTTQIKREANGVIHIVAQRLDDAFFAQGVASAQERLWTLEMVKRAVEGTMSEVLGDKGLDIDKLSRTLGIHRNAKIDYAAIKDSNPVEFNYMQRFVDGINAYINMGSHYHPEYLFVNGEKAATLWNVTHVIGAAKLLAWEYDSHNARAELEKFVLTTRGVSISRMNTIFPIVFNSTNPVVTDHTLDDATSQAQQMSFRDDSLAAGGSASTTPVYPYILSFFTMKEIPNPYPGKAWAVSGSMTSSKKPILASDIHLPFMAPNFMLLTHISASDDGVDLAGSSFPFLPSVVQGRSKTTAWGFTNAFTDNQDLFAINRFNSTHYTAGPDTYLPFIPSVEIIKIRSAFPSPQNPTTFLEFIPMPFRSTSTAFGPIINFVTGTDVLTPLSLYWAPIRSTYADPDKTVISMCFGIPLATSYNAFLNGTVDQKSPALNYIFAESVNDTVSYALSGRHYSRVFGHSGRYPVSGLLSNFPSIININDLPASTGLSMYVSTSNEIAAPGYPFALSFNWQSNYRQDKIVAALKAGSPNLTPQTMLNIMNDVYSPIFHDFVSVFEQMKENGNFSKSYVPYLDKLLAWDGNEGKDMDNAAIFEMWLKKLPDFFTKETVGNSRIEIQNQNYEFFKHIFAENNTDPTCELWTSTPAPGSCIGFAMKKFYEAVDDLISEFGTAAVSWGTGIHKAEFNNPHFIDNFFGCLVNKQYFVAGSDATIDSTSTSLPSLKSKSGIHYKQIIGFNAGTDSWMIPLGQSGNFLSPWYTSFVNYYKSGAMYPMSMSRGDQLYNLFLKH